MTPDRSLLRHPRTLIAVAAGLLIVAGGAAWWRMATLPDPAQPPLTETPTNPAPEEATAQAYLLILEGDRTTLTPIPVPSSTNDPEQLLASAMQQLLASPPADGDTFSAIPEETTLRSLEIRTDGIYVDLSSQFTTGGGSAAMQGRLGQILYTATSLEPDAAVWLSVEGEPLELLGGEGLIVPQPMTRSDFEQNFSL